MKIELNIILKHQNSGNQNDIHMKNKLLIVLKALLEGYQIKVKIGDEYETLALSEDNYLCLKMLSHNVDGSENE